MVADLLSLNRRHWYIANVKNHNMNVTEIRYSASPMPFPGIFNFTGGILFKNHETIKVDGNIYLEI